MHHGGDSSSQAAAVARRTRTRSDFGTSPLEQESSTSYYNTPVIQHGRHADSRPPHISTAQSQTRNISATTTTSRHKDRKAPPIFHFLAGLVTGSLSAVLLQPADLLKTRVQQSQARTSVSRALREILSQPGVVRQLWRGTLPSVIRTGFGSALYFASLSTLRSTFANNAALTGGGLTANKLETPERRVTFGKSGGKGRSVEQEPGKMAEHAWSETGEGAILRDSEAIKKAELLPGPALDSTVTVHTPPALPANYHHQSMNSGASTPSTSLATTNSSSALPKLSNAANLLTGALARSGAGLVMMPITVLKVRYESSLYSSYHAGSASSGGTGLIGAARTIFAREGLRGLYAGYGATLVRDAPYAGLYVLFYERAKGFLGRVETPGPHSPPSSNFSNVTSDGKQTSQALGFIGNTTQANTINFGAGVIAAAAATAVTNPFDAIKTRIQLMPARYRNTASAAATMMREEGPRAFFDGLGLRMARKAMSSALAWTIYEDLVRRAEKRYAEVG